MFMFNIFLLLKKITFKQALFRWDLIINLDLDYVTHYVCEEKKIYPFLYLFMFPACVTRKAR